jgi:hypothetical protein
MKMDDELTAGPQNAVALAEDRPGLAEVLEGVDGVDDVDARIRQRDRGRRRLHETDAGVLLGPDADDLRVALDANRRERLRSEEGVEDVSPRAPELGDDLVAQRGECPNRSRYSAIWLVRSAT